MKLTTFFICTFILAVFVSFSFAYAYRLEVDWNEYKSDHFIIFYHQSIPSKYVRELTRKCERYYYLIADRLGLKRFEYWSWENRAKIFIYESKEQYIKKTGRPYWSAASVQIKKKSISTYYFEEGFFNSVLLHELTHIILREFIGFNRKIPLWFEEGVACANEDKSYLRFLLPAKNFLSEGLYVSVEEMERMDAKGMTSNKIFYPIAASLVIFLLEDYGKGDFVQLCKELRDGEAFYDAMDKVYDIENAQDLNENFLTFLENKSYEDITTRESFSVKW